MMAPDYARKRDRKHKVKFMRWKKKAERVRLQERKKVRTRSNKGKRDQKRIPKCVQKRHQPPDEDDDEVVELPRPAC